MVLSLTLEVHFIRNLPVFRHTRTRRSTSASRRSRRRDNSGNSVTTAALLLAIAARILA